MRIFHVAPRAAWTSALRSGSYTSATLDRDGFTGAAKRDQVAGVLEDHAREAEPVVVLEIETDLLDCPWEEVDVDGTAYPHVLGPVNTRAVLDVQPGHPGFWSQRGVSPMTPPVVQIFGGLGVMLSLASAVLLISAAIAHHKSHPTIDRPATVTHSTEFLLWSLTAVCAVAAVTAWSLAASLRTGYRRRTAWRP